MVYLQHATYCHPGLNVISARGRLRSGILAGLIQRVHSCVTTFPSPNLKQIRYLSDLTNADSHGG
jgi:hypothetical protein